MPIRLVGILSSTPASRLEGILTSMPSRLVGIPSPTLASRLVGILSKTPASRLEDIQGFSTVGILSATPLRACFSIRGYPEPDTCVLMFPRRALPLSGDNDGPVPESAAAVRDGRVTICSELNCVVFRAKGRRGTDVYSDCIWVRFWDPDFTDWFDSDFRKLQSLIFHHLLEPSSNPWKQALLPGSGQQLESLGCRLCCCNSQRFLCCQSHVDASEYHPFGGFGMKNTSATHVEASE